MLRPAYGVTNSQVKWGILVNQRGHFLFAKGAKRALKPTAFRSISEPCLAFFFSLLKTFVEVLDSTHLLSCKPHASRAGTSQ